MNAHTTCNTATETMPPAIGTAANPPGSPNLAYVVEIAPDDGPVTFTIGAGMARNRFRIILANRHGYVSSPLSEHIAAPMIRRAAHVPPISEDEAAAMYAEAKVLAAASRAEATRRIEEQQTARQAAIAEVERYKPEWATHALIAELVEDDSDSMTDYYNSRTMRRVVLAWARHGRDLFPEMRKAARLLPETADLADAPESAEHREKYSMGGGYYLKAGYRHSTGWRVSKHSAKPDWLADPRLTFTDAAKAGQDVAGALSDAPAKAGARLAAQPAPKVSGGFTISKHKHTKRGFDMWICELPGRVERAVYDALLAAAKDLGGWYSRPWGTTPGGFAFKVEENALQFAIENGGGDAPDGPGKPGEVERPAPAERAPSQAMGDKLRAMADSLNDKAADCFRDRLSNTPKRARQAAEKRNEGLVIERAQAMLRALASRHDAGTVPPVLADIRSRAAVLRLAAEETDRSGGYYDAGTPLGRPYPWGDADDIAQAAALWTLIDDGASDRATQAALAVKLDALRFAKIPGYFPTPRELIARMIEAAELEPGARVLEPSAGSGAIADAVREAGHSVECVERWPSLCEVLELKRHMVERGDFLDRQPTGDLYDAVLMNPPFENGQDCEHVSHAWRFVRPGGTLVAIMGQGVTFRQNGPHKAARDWLEELGAEIVEIEAGAFKESGTGVATVMVVIRKGGEA